MAFLLRNTSRSISRAIQTTYALSGPHSYHPIRSYPLQTQMSPHQTTSTTIKPWAPTAYIRPYTNQTNEEEPTVERDTSSLANELREEFNGLKKAAFDVSRGLLLVGITHLACGAWIQWVTKTSPFSQVCVQSYIAFAFPLALAFMVRRMMKPICFFTKLEERGRLQILTLALQVTRGVTALFRRIHALAVVCAAAISIGLLANAYPS